MTTTFQSCPGCDSFILSDTFECPECGHVFDEARAAAAADVTRDIRNQSMYDSCRKCGESVRSGLVRCWNCNAFMRKDVEDRYEAMQTAPQQIIFSEVPREQRTEILEARHDHRKSNRVFDAQADNEFEFTLRSGDVAKQEGDDFELSTSHRASRPVSKTPAAEISQVTVPVPAEPVAAPAVAPVPAPVPAEPTKPAPVAAIPAAEATPEVKPDATPVATEAPVADATAEPDKPPESKPAAEKKAPHDFDVDDLVGIALQDQKETRSRKKKKVEEAKSKRILLPCSRCGAWIRVHQDQGGKTLRCRQCKFPFLVPLMKKKGKSPKSARAAAAPKIEVSWLDDVKYHVVVPTAIVLKPGSMQKTAESVDLAFHETGLHVLKYAAPAKKSLFGKSDGPPAVEEQRRLNREHIAKTSGLSKIPFGDLQTIDRNSLSKVRLVQPVAEAHESMFAGVPVFGAGRIALYLPITLGDNKQGLVSLTITGYRKFAQLLQKHFQTELNAKQNGVPVTDEVDTFKCNISSMPVTLLKNLEYYQNDPGYELELAGYQCGTCSIVVAEAARAQQKLGGATGKGIAKAKCPGCQNKMGLNKLFKIAKSPEDSATDQEDEEDVSSVLTAPLPTSKSTSTAASGSLSSKDLQGTWKMVSLGRAGQFDKPDDMTSAGIEFIVEADRYRVVAGGAVQEQGVLVLKTDEAPVHLDQQVTAGADAGKSHLGLARILDGKLQNCQAALGEPRPDSFNPRPDSTASLATFARS